MAFAEESWPFGQKNDQNQRNPAASKHLRIWAFGSGHQGRFHKSGDDMRDDTGAGVAGVKISEDGDGKRVVGVARDIAGESLPCPTVLNELVAAEPGDVPAEAVIARVGIAVVERVDGSRCGRGWLG